MKTEIASPPFWFNDLCSCLHNNLASLLIQHGRDPVLTLGAKWEFCFLPGELRREEYYYPCRQPTLAQCLAPYHPITSCWHFPADAKAGWEEVRQWVAGGRFAIVAVDNHYLPFRPAYQDVHAAHLIIVRGFDDETDQVYVFDSTPPAFDGPMSLAELTAARGSNCGADDRDVFFAGTPLAHRWLSIEFNGDFPALSRDWVAGVLRRNLEDFRSPSIDTALTGMDGAWRYFADVCRRMESPNGQAALEELYVFGWAMQAVTALHADFLMQAGRRLGWPDLAEAGRRVDQLAHHWTTLRMTAAHGALQPPEAGRRIAHLSRRLLYGMSEVLEEMARLACH